MSRSTSAASVAVETQSHPTAPAAGLRAAGATAYHRTLTERLFAAGAIMTEPGPPVVRSLVGHFVWLDAGQVFWFAAYGHSLADAHLLVFDETRPIADFGVCF